MIQLGRIIASTGKNVDKGVEKSGDFYDLVLVDSGQLVQAILAMPAKGSSTRLEINDHVLVVYVSGAWVINGVLPQYVKSGTAAPRSAELNPGDQFVGNQETGAGMHIQGGMVTMEGAGIDSKGNATRSTQTIWAPDSDAIRNLCRRFDIDASTGNVQLLHDDLTGETAFRIWARQFAETGFDGRLSRIHMGYHRNPPGATFSITTFPPGPDPTFGLLDFAFAMNPVKEAIPFAGQWPILEREDWQTRYYVLEDGTAVYENALVPVPSIVPTTEASAMVRVIISPEGLITTTANGLVTLTALSNLIAIKTAYTLTASTVSITSKTFIGLQGETITAFAPDVILGSIEDAFPLCNENLFTWAVSQLVTFCLTHTHISASPGSPTSPATQPLVAPDATMITKLTTAS